MKALWVLCESMNFHPDKQLFQVASPGNQTTDPWITRSMLYLYTTVTHFKEMLYWNFYVNKVFNNFDRPVEQVSAWFSPSAYSVVSTYVCWDHVCFSLNRLVPFSNTCFVQQMNVYFQQRLSSSSTQSHLLAMLGQQADRWKYYIYGFSTQHGKINKRH